MSFVSDLITNYDCRHVVVVRWDNGELSNVGASAKVVVSFIEKVGFKIGNKDRIGYSPTPTQREQFIILPMKSVEEAQRICNASVNDGFGIGTTRIYMNLLLGKNGVRLRDGADFMKISQDHFTNSEILDLLVVTIRLELPERLEVIETGFNLIKHGLCELIENASCEMFGSFASTVRRTGFSDIDINAQASLQPGERPVTPRQLKQIAAYPKCLVGHPLTKAELEEYPREETIKLLHRCFSGNEVFTKIFDIRYVAARTPILIFKTISADGINVSYDVSICNQLGVDKANLLDEFILKDKSAQNKMKNAMLFIVYWARSNNLLPGAYSLQDEKLEPKTNLNSYIFNQLIIHFVQAHADRILVHPQAKLGSRVDEYNFDQLFTDHSKFLSEFFKYYASFDFTTKAIYGKQAMQKKTMIDVHGAKMSPLMMMDPMDCTHNISANVTEEAVKLLNGLIRNTLYILKQKNFRIQFLLETNQTAVALMKGRESTINVTTKTVEGQEVNYMSVQLPSIIKTSDEMMLLLKRVLRFDVSPNYQGPSTYDLFNRGGIIFSIQSKSWIGRRNKKRQLKSARGDLTPLQLDVMCSDTYQYEDDQIAELRIVMGNVQKMNIRFAYIEMLKGQVSEVRDAMHYLMDQFLFNNLDDLTKNGIMSIANIPSAETLQLS